MTSLKNKISVVSVKEVRGMMFGQDMYPNQYNSNRVTTNSNDPKALLVRGTIDGVDTSFFSPTVIVRETKGYVNFRMMNDNPWFELIEGETRGYKGHEMFDGGSTPNVAISTPSEIVVKIKVGDVLDISYRTKGEFNGTKTIKNVKIL
jgi:hypothetical protein